MIGWECKYVDKNSRAVNQVARRTMKRGQWVGHESVVMHEDGMQTYDNSVFKHSKYMKPINIAYAASQGAWPDVLRRSK